MKRFLPIRDTQGQADKEDKMAYDMSDISATENGPLEVEAKDKMFDDVPQQSSYSDNNSIISQHDREIRNFPMAFCSKLLFFFGCAMYLWLSFDDLRWAHDAQAIPQTVLEADDDFTWRRFRISQRASSTVSAESVSQQSSTGNAYTRTSSNQESPEDEDEITWSKLRNNGGARTRQLKQRIIHERRQEENDLSFHSKWDELPFSKQIAAATLGHNEESWNNGGPAFTDTIRWDDLTPEQQDAATILGYDQYLWDLLRGFVDVQITMPTAGTLPITMITPVPTTSPVPMDTTAQYDKSAASQAPSSTVTMSPYVDWLAYQWSELPEEIRGAATALGYTEDLWNAGNPISTDGYFWSELSDAQQSAATIIFGYNQITWNAANNRWQTIPWVDLPSNIRSYAAVLGYNQDLWDAGEAIDTRAHAWNELSGEQQQAVFVVFGLTEETWGDASASSQVNASHKIKNNGGGRGGGRGGADDDYVFSVENGGKDVWVSTYQIVYFVASLCFVSVGILDIIRECRLVHMFMLLAGIFDLFASMWIETDLFASNILHCMSAHFLVGQSTAIFFYRKHLRALISTPFKNALWLADASFALGAFMQVILSYMSFSEDSRQNLGVARTDSFATLLLLFAALIYLVITPIVAVRHTNKQT